MIRDPLCSFMLANIKEVIASAIRHCYRSIGEGRMEMSLVLS